ncbi:hypothetical protein N9F34_01030 [Alphaproteobacteria bacterium]|nr:hypothetical protein [Alphaproteobacteria bacterium]
MRDHHIQEQFGCGTAPAGAAIQDRFGHVLEERRHLGERRVVGSDHYADFPITAGLRGTGDRRVDIGRTFGREGDGDLLAGAYWNCTAINDDLV